MKEYSYHVDTTQADCEIVCTRNVEGKKTTLRIKVFSDPSEAAVDNGGEQQAPEIIYSVTDVSDIEQGKGGFVDGVKNKHDTIATDQANAVRRDTFRKEDLQTSIAMFQQHMEAQEKEKKQRDVGNEIVRAFAAQYDEIAVEQTLLARRGSARTLDLPDLGEGGPNLGRRGSGFMVSSALGYEGIKNAQLSPGSPTVRRGSATNLDISGMSTLLPDLARRNSGIVDAMKSRHEEQSKKGGDELDAPPANYKPQRRGSARIDDLAKQFQGLAPGSDVTVNF